MSATCRATKAAPNLGPGGTWECSRPRGHEGRHQARDLNGTLWAQWAKRKPAGAMSA